MADIKAGNEAARFNPLDFPQSLDLPKRFKALPWHEHIPFAKVLVQLLRPKVFVKVGLQTGESYLAICETAAALGVACYGVGGKRVQHVGIADEKAMKDLHAYHDAQYGNFSRLLKNDATEAAAHFAPGSVDLLHIDNLHTYDGVCRDWETWRPKLSRSGVVLFHHTNVRDGDYGVWKLWKELRPTYRNFEFLHGAGLGVLVAGQTIPEPLSNLLSWAEKKSRTGAQDFFALGNRLTQRSQNDLDRDTIADLQARLKVAEGMIVGRDAQIEEEDKEHTIAVERFVTKIDQLELIARARSEEAEQLAPLCVSRLTEIEKLNAKIAEQTAILTSRADETQPLKERIEKLEAEVARVREKNERLSKSMSFRWGRTLTAPFRLFIGEKAL